MINCQEAAQRLYDYLDNELESLRREELEEHLAACRHCYGVAEFEKLLRAILQDRVKRERLPKDLQDRIRKELDKLS